MREGDGVGSREDSRVVTHDVTRHELLGCLSRRCIVQTRSNTNSKFFESYDRV